MHGRVALGLREQVADAARAHADEHLDELRAGDQDLGRPLERLVDDRADFLVDRLGDLVAVVPLLADLAAEEDELVALARTTSGPSLSLIPNSVTIRRARSVAFSMSLLAPVVVSPKISRSATLPPSSPAILSSNSVLDWR